MKPDTAWTRDWRLGENPELEHSVSSDLIELFSDFRVAEEIESRSKTTRRRYSSALHALGGYIVEQAVRNESKHGSVMQRLVDAVQAGDGPLIFLDHEAWQRELDTVCRRLGKYLMDRRKEGR